MHDWIARRSSALLLHISSLPGPFHKGVLGIEAKQLIERISESGMRIWQFLPLGPTHGHGSPYESLSSFAGNPEFIDLRVCADRGWLHHEAFHGELDTDAHARLRKQAAAAFHARLDHDSELAGAVDRFRREEQFWLEDFAKFTALKALLENRAWWQWPEPLRDRDSDAIDAAIAGHGELIDQIIFEQFIFAEQWQALKAHAEACGVELFGDLPIYVAHDSADVWANQPLFTLNQRGLCSEVAGVPPDYFSATGQRWGNPLYHWELMQEDGFSWWCERISQQLKRMHLLRIDHFRGLEAFWAIPGESEDGIIGEWRPAPGDALLETLQQRFGELPLIAEDLGIITDEVTALREKYGLPGMKILQFAFGGGDDNPYLPHNHEADSVVYTGTHDNDTSMGWFSTLDEHTREHVERVTAAFSQQPMPWSLIETALASVAKLAVIPMQDLLGLGSEAKFNTPGTLENNWCWRLDAIPEADHEAWRMVAELNTKHQR